MSKKTAKATLTNAELAIKLERALAAGRANYAKARDIETALAALGAGHVIELPDGRQAVIVDQFAEKNTVFKPTGVSRFTVEFREKPPEVAHAKA